MTQNSAYHVSGLLEKMTASDKDFRFMATNDLMTELEGDSLRLDDDSERRVTKTILKLLEDRNGEVQNLAVKCLGPLVKKIKEANIVLVIKELTIGMNSSDKDNIRGICGIGLKTIINETNVHHATVASVAARDATGQLIEMVEKHADISVRLEALEILTEMLNKFGVIMAPHHDLILRCCVDQLSSPRLAIRKRAISALGHLVCCSTHEQFDALINHLLRQLKQPPPGTKPEDTKTYIQCLTVLTRHPSRTSEYVHEIQPLLMACATKEDDEIRDFVLQGLETLVRRCPRQMSKFLPQMVPLLLRFLQHDPNYQYEEEDDDEKMELDDDEEEEGDEEEDYSDDDDIAWKVRRSAAKCLEACVLTFPDQLLNFYQSVAPVLIKRFIEREETVKLEIFVAFQALLKQTATTLARASSRKHSESQLQKPDSVNGLLQALIPSLIRSLQKHSRSKSIQVRAGCFSLLKEIANTLPQAFVQHIDVLIPLVVFSMNDKQSNNNMKVESLSFLVLLLASHTPTCFAPHIQELISIAGTFATDPFYRIACEALSLIQSLAAIVRPLGFGDKALVLYDPTLCQLQATDRDLELKEKAIACMASLIYYVGDILQPSLTISALSIITERLHNEITRYQAVKALTTIAESPLKLDFSHILPRILGELPSFLRKNDRALRVVTLKCLEVLWLHHATLMTIDHLSPIIKELPPMISDNDLQITQLSVHLIELFLTVHGGAVAPVVNSTLLQPLVLLAHSPLLHGVALDSLLSLFSTISRLDLQQLNYQLVFHHLLEPLKNQMNPNQEILVHKDAFPILARCVAELVRNVPLNELTNIINCFINDVMNDKINPSIQLLSLLTLGEIGRTVDLSDRQDLLELIMTTFNTRSEEMKVGAAFTLGKMALGSLNRIMPYIMQQIEKQPRQQYFLLHSLREIIGSLSVASEEQQMVLTPYMDTIWSLLLMNSGVEEEGTRNLVAECLGKLTLMNPISLLPKLRHLVQSEQGSTTALSRCTIVSAVKYTIINTPHLIDSVLQQNIQVFLSCLRDSDLNVRRASLIIFNTAAHNKPELIRDLLPELLPSLYNETTIKKELIREVEMGPFKHQEDDGLDLRKGAFECMNTLLESCLDKIDIPRFLIPVEEGLKDHGDIKLLTYLMLTRLCTLCPVEIAQKVDALLAPIKTVLISKLKADSVKQEVEKLEELKRSAMRVVIAISKLEDIEKNRYYNEFMKTVIHQYPELRKMLQSVNLELNSQQQGPQPMEVGN